MQERDSSDWLLILGLFVAGLFAAAQFGKVALTLTDVAAHYGRSTAGVAYLVSIVGGVGILLGAVAGSVVAALGARRVLLAALWAGAAISATQAFLPPEPVFAVTRFLEGMSHLLIVVAAPTLIAGAASPSGRPVAMSIWSMFFGVSFALLGIALPGLLPRIGLSGLFAAHAIGLAAVAVALSPMLARQPRAPLNLDPLAVHRRIYTVPRRALPGLAFVFYTVMFVALVSLLPIALGRPGLAITLPIISLSGSLVAGVISRRVHPATVMVAGFAGLALCSGLVWWGMVSAIYPMFALMGLVPGAAFALIPHLNATQEGRALATGGIAQMGNVGTTFGTPIFALLLAHGGLDLLWLGLVALAGSGIMVVLTTIGRTRAPEEVPAP